MKKPPQDLSQLLHQSGTLPDIAEKAELLLYLDQHVKQIVAGPIAEQLKVANFRQGVLVVETTSAAWARTSSTTCSTAAMNGSMPA